MKVCGRKDIHVPECSECSELEERVTNVEECCEANTEALADKVDKEEGKGLSSVDFTSEDKLKLDTTQEELVSGVNIKTINNQSILGAGDIQVGGGGGGGVKNIWYATCPTGSSTAQKVVTTDTGDFSLSAGNMLRVLFTYSNTASAPTLKVDSSTATPDVRVVTGTSGAQYQWQAGEVVDFVYNGTYFLMVNRATATTTYFGVTKLTSSTASTSTTLAATASAVKSAYDLANSVNTAITGGGLSSSLFDITTSQLLNSTNIGAYDHSYGTVGVAHTGGSYYPLGIVGWNSPDMRYFTPARLRLSARDVSQTTISYDIYNAHSSAHTGSFTADILWLKITS